LTADDQAAFPFFHTAQLCDDQKESFGGDLFPKFFLRLNKKVG